MSSSPSLNSILISFSELVTAHVTQTLSFHLPPSSGLVASVITPAIQKEVISAAVAAITLASGQAPSNMTVIPTFSTSSVDGSITISFLIDATLSKIVNTKTFISAAAYAADPIGSTAIAVKSATGGIIVQSAAISLTTAARQSATSVCALIDNTPTTNTLVSRIANIIQINASSITGTGVCAKVDDAIISKVFGVVTSGDEVISGSTTAATGLSLTELLQSGGIAGFTSAVISFFILYAISRRISNNNKIKKENIITTFRSGKIKSKHLQQQLKPPKKKPSNFQHTHTENPGSVNNSSLGLATTINPLRAVRSTTKISSKR